MIINIFLCILFSFFITYSLIPIFKKKSWYDVDIHQVKKNINKIVKDVFDWLTKNKKTLNKYF